MLEEVFVRWFGQNRIVWGLVGGVVLALMNMVGALAILVWRDPSDRGLDASLGFAGGVMISASFTSLIIPGIERYGSLLSVGVGFALGVLFLAAADRWVPHVHTLITGETARRRGPTAGRPPPGVNWSRRRGLPPSSCSSSPSRSTTCRRGWPSASASAPGTSVTPSR